MSVTAGSALRVVKAVGLFEHRCFVPRDNHLGYALAVVHGELLARKVHRILGKVMAVVSNGSPPSFL